MSKDKLTARTIANAILSPSEDTKNETDNTTPKPVGQLPKLNIRKQSIPSPLPTDSIDSHSRNNASDPEMPGLQPRAQHDEISSDDNSNVDSHYGNNNNY